MPMRYDRINVPIVKLCHSFSIAKIFGALISTFARQSHAFMVNLIPR